MARSSAKLDASLLLVHGDDEFGVKQRSRQVFDQWCLDAGGEDHEIVDGQAGNSGEALKALNRVREALQTLPFFGGAKVVWLRNCTFFGDERAASAQAVTESLGDWAKELKVFSWEKVRLLISAGKVDKRKTFYKTVDKLGSVEVFAAWSVDDKDWAEEAEGWVRRGLKARKKEISDEALSELVSRVGPDRRQLVSEVEKLTLYVGEQLSIGLSDVEGIVSRQKQARAFALADALGERDLPRLMRTLDEELWSMKGKRGEIGLLYGLITKVRVMLFLKEMMRERWVAPSRDFRAFRAQLSRVPAGALPEDKRFNPLSMNPYLLFKALPHAGRYSIEELVGAMALLLECNQRLVSSQLDQSLVLQQTLVRIVRGEGGDGSGAGLRGSERSA